jgi:hypothetical protein
VRIFYPKTFNIVRANKDVFAGHIDPLTENEGPQKYIDRLDNLLKSTGELTDDLRDLLLELFPKLTYAYGRITHGHYSETEWDKTYRIGTTRYFDAYFGLSLPTSEISIEEITTFIEKSDSESMLENILVAWIRKGKVKRAIESLRYRLAEIPRQNLERLFYALLVAGDVASDSGVIFAGNIPEFWHVRWAIFDVLESMPAPVRVARLKEVFGRSVAIKTMINITALIQESREKDRTKYAEFTDDDIQRIKAIIVGRIEEFAKEPAALLQHPALPMILHMWKDWGSEDEQAREFVKQATLKDDDLVKFVNAFIYQTHSSSGRVVETKNHLSMKALAEWQDLEQLTERLRKAESRTVVKSQQEILKIALAELDRMKEKGLTPEEFDKDRFFD